MTTIEHAVAPEDVMALLDGELSVAEARVVSAHLEQCGECARLAEELRSTSRSIARWSAPTVPDGIEGFVMDRAGQMAAGRTNAKHKGWIHVGFGRRKLLLSGGAAVLALLTLVVFSRIGSRPAPVREAAMTGSVDGNAISPVFEDKLQARSMAAPRMTPPPPSPPPRPAAVAGVAGMGGAGVRVEKEDGPPVRNARNYFAAAESRNGPLGGLQTPAPMIARTVSLTIVVKDVDAARASLESILSQHRGYSAQLYSMTPEDGPRSLQSSLRIPEGELRSTVALIKALG
jgi:anti-sigma factor RsiW